MGDIQFYGHEEVAAWLREPETTPDEPTDQDWDLVMADCLDGGFPGHIAFYLHEPIPSERRRSYLLNTLYVMAWTRFLQGNLETLPAGVEAARASGREELISWAMSVEKHLASGLKPNHKFWCDWGWRRPGVPVDSLDLIARIKQRFRQRGAGQSLK